MMDVALPIPNHMLDAEPFPAYVVSPTGEIIYTNNAWDKVALEANGPSAAVVRGTRWLDHIVGAELQAWHEAPLARVLGYRVGEVHLCDCNTPDRFRLFVSRFEPLVQRGSGEPVGMLVLSGMLQSAPMVERYQVGRPSEHRYLTPEGIFRQCSGCRRVEVADGSPPLWEFVPEYVSLPRRDVSYGICQLCRETYYQLPERDAP